jgi:hypothetical protein
MFGSGILGAVSWAAEQMCLDGDGDDGGHAVSLVEHVPSPDINPLWLSAVNNFLGTNSSYYQNPSS